MEALLWVMHRVCDWRRILRGFSARRKTSGKELSTVRNYNTCVAPRFTSLRLTHLQWTTMGPASEGLHVFTRRRNARMGVGYSGTPWSGQAMNWNCLTSLFSLEPFCTRSTGTTHRRVSPKCDATRVEEGQSARQKLG